MKPWNTFRIFLRFCVAKTPHKRCYFFWFVFFGQAKKMNKNKLTSYSSKKKRENKDEQYNFLLHFPMGA